MFTLSLLNSNKRSTAVFEGDPELAVTDGKSSLRVACAAFDPTNQRYYAVHNENRIVFNVQTNHKEFHERFAVAMRKAPRETLSALVALKFFPDAQAKANGDKMIVEQAGAAAAPHAGMFANHKSPFLLQKLANIQDDQGAEANVKAYLKINCVQKEVFYLTYTHFAGCNGVYMRTIVEKVINYLLSAAKPKCPHWQNFNKTKLLADMTDVSVATRNLSKSLALRDEDEDGRGVLGISTGMMFHAVNKLLYFPTTRFPLRRAGFQYLDLSKGQREALTAIPEDTEMCCNEADIGRPSSGWFRASEMTDEDVLQFRSPFEPDGNCGPFKNQPPLSNRLQLIAAMCKCVAFVASNKALSDGIQARLWETQTRNDVTVREFYTQILADSIGPILEFAVLCVDSALCSIDYSSRCAIDKILTSRSVLAGRLVAMVLTEKQDLSQDEELRNGTLDLRWKIPAAKSKKIKRNVHMSDDVFEGDMFIDSRLLRVDANNKAVMLESIAAVATGEEEEELVKKTKVQSNEEEDYLVDYMNM